MPARTAVILAFTIREFGIPRRRIAIKVGIPTGAPEVRARNQSPKKLMRTTVKRSATTPTAIRRNKGISDY
jgi:hypothetical protein